MTALMLTLTLMTGCGGAGTVRKDRIPDGAPQERARRAVMAACYRDGDATSDRWVCTQDAVSVAIHALVDAAYDIRDLRARLEAAAAMARIDSAELAGKIAAVSAERDSARSQRWVWGAVGVALGAIVAGLVAGLAH